MVTVERVFVGGPHDGRRLTLDANVMRHTTDLGQVYRLIGMWGRGFFLHDELSAGQGLALLLAAYPTSPAP